MRTRNKVILFVSIFTSVLLVALLYSLRRTEQGRSTSDTQVNVSQEAKRGSAATLTSTYGSGPNNLNSPDASVENGDENSTTPEPLQPDPEEREHNAQIGYVIDDFRGFGKSLDGYTLEGLKRTEEGLTLDTDEATSITAAGAVLGVLESPSLALGFPSNAVQPIWRAKTSEDGTIQVEISLSPDGENWSHWYPSEPTGDDISPTYPDGRPNPNYGAVSGGAIANGLRLLPYVRYRVTLTAYGEKRPVLHEFKITHLDSTDGQGELATEPPAISTTPAPMAVRPEGSNEPRPDESHL